MKTLLLFLVLLLLSASLALWVRHGGGEPYPDLTTPALLGDEALEEVLSYPEPIGNVAVNKTGRVFFTVHPEARPDGNRLLEFVQGASVPFPDGASQQQLFDTVLGVVIDRFDRLWTIDHGNHGLRTPRLLGFDLATGKLIHDERFGASIAPRGSFLQDLQVSPDGRTVIIADASFWRKAPALIVYDIATGTARRVLEKHPSVSAEDYMIQNGGQPMSFLGGLVALRGGVDGIAINEEWLYFAALSGSSLYRVALGDLRNAALPDTQLAARVERFAGKPLSDGLSIDNTGNVYVTDVEHNAVMLIGADRAPRTLLRSAQVRWPDALSFGPEGWLYLADSALGDVILQSRDRIAAAGPYRIYRFRPGATGIPGQ
jgi:sugar lactone lactonase YvrE